MRTVPAPTATYLQKNLGTNPTLILGIIWAEGGEEVLYADQKIDGADYPYPTLVQISGFDTALMVSGSGDSQSISVTLDDVDGQLKWITNNYDIHKLSVKLYHHFQGLHLDNKFLVFQGEINSPVVWDEGRRKLSFTILTHTEDAEVAFSMEEGDFPNIPEEALGKVWPLVFGQVCNMSVNQVRSPRKGYLIAGEGWHDFTITPRLCQARYIQCPSIALGEVTTLEQDPLGGGYEQEETMEYGPDPNCVDDRFEAICNLLSRLEQETAYEHDVINIRGGDAFPQGETITLSIDSALLIGSFNGTYFTVINRTHPEYEDWDHVACVAIEDHAYSIQLSNWNDNWEETETGTAWYHNQDPVETLADCQPASGIWRRAPSGGASASWRAYEDIEAAGFVWKPAGSEVFLQAEAEILYTVSLIPGTVDSVAAYRTMPNGRSLLMEIPSEYYTIYETDYDGYQVVEIGFEKKLSLYDSDWADALYVSFTSDVGPNPVDTIEWLLDKYTSLTYDSTTFTDVKSKLTNYPSNFYVNERTNVLELIHDIAYQSRCAVYIRNDVVFIKYLSEEPTPVRTITESDIIADTFMITLTETENVITKHTIGWKKADAMVEEEDETNLKIILKHNVAKYGITEQGWNYYTQNLYDVVLKSATFWLIRRANTWKHVEFDMPLRHLDLDIFDCVTLDVAQFSATPVKVVIESSMYNPDTNTIHFRCWTPILAGTDAAYFWAWPAQQPEVSRFPLSEEEAQAGSGYSFTVTPPIDHLLRSGYTDTGDAPTVILTSGDQNPSDIGDSTPSVACNVADTFDLEEEDPVFEALRLARNARDSVSEVQQGGPPPGGGGSDSKKKPRKACGQPEYGTGCLYEVTVTYVWPNKVTSGRILGGCLGGPCQHNVCGSPCTGLLSQFCHTFGAAFSAWAFYQAKREEIKALREGCGYCSQLTTYPYSVSAPKTIADTSGCPGCADCQSFPGLPGSPNQGESHEPTKK